MDPEFTTEELSLLEDVLREFLTDLRIEIANTDDYTFRQGLKRKSEMLQTLLAKCEQPKTVAVH